MTFTRHRRLRRWLAGGAIAGSIGLGLATPTYAGVNPDSVGAGTLLTTVDFGGAPIPPLMLTSPTVQLDDQCSFPTWTMSDNGSVAAYFDDKGLFYPGPMAISGNGVSHCDSISQGSGSFGVSTSGSNVLGGSIACSGMSGNYLREGVVVQFTNTANGTCTILGQTVPIGLSGVAAVYPVCLTTITPNNCPYGTGFNNYLYRIAVRGAWFGTA